MQKTVIANTHFLGSEGMWAQGDEKHVSEIRANELLQAGLVTEKETGETEATKVAEVSPAPAPDPAKRETKPAKVKVKTK